MTQKARGSGGDNRDQNPEGTTTEFTELRILMVEMQTATQVSSQVTQASIQQLGDTVGTLAARLDALTTALTTRLNFQAPPVDHVPLPPAQQQLPLQQQQQFPPIHQHPRPNQQRRQHQQQIGDVRVHDLHEEEEEDHRRVYRNDLRQRDLMDTRWENSFKVDILEFHGGLKGDDLLDWLISVEEILEFKQVPAARQVPLVAMRFRGHAATWWKQLKTTRSRTGKAPIQSWDKLTKHLRQTFLPHNYERTMYTRLQNLRQGNRSVDEYAEEFAMLLTRNEINDSQIQLVSRFIGGLRQQLQTAMAQFDPATIGEAHRHAASFEQQSRTSNWNSSSTRSRPNEPASSNTPLQSSN
uniref:Retrotransposon gag domain-containing protein n=1 Tax=Brassica oleracea var. oleracea TaxID=109376 RepID=A0A0D2ZVK6_BRAOL